MDGHFNHFICDVCDHARFKTCLIKTIGRYLIYQWFSFKKRVIKMIEQEKFKNRTDDEKSLLKENGKIENEMKTV